MIFVPHQQPDESFVRWLREQYGPYLMLKWSDRKHRWMLGTPNSREHRIVTLLLLENPDGSMMSLGESAKALIKSRIQPADKAVSEMEDAYKKEAEMEEKRKEKRRREIGDLFREERHRIFGDPVVPVGNVGFLKKKAN